MLQAVWILTGKMIGPKKLQWPADSRYMSKQHEREETAADNVPVVTALVLALSMAVSFSSRLDVT
jgi:hypothetical protein